MDVERARWEVAFRRASQYLIEKHFICTNHLYQSCCVTPLGRRMSKIKLRWFTILETPEHLFDLEKLFSTLHEGKLGGNRGG